VYTSPFLDTDELKMALGPEKSPGLSGNGPQVCSTRIMGGQQYVNRTVLQLLKFFGKTYTAASPY